MNHKADYFRMSSMLIHKTSKIYKLFLITFNNLSTIKELEGQKKASPAEKQDKRISGGSFNFPRT